MLIKRPNQSSSIFDDPFRLVDYLPASLLAKVENGINHSKTKFFQLLSGSLMNATLLLVLKAQKILKTDFLKIE